MPTIPYTLSNGDPVKGATTMLQAVSFGPADPLIHWGVKLAKAGKSFITERKAAAQRGTRLHLVVEQWPEPPTRLPEDTDEWWVAALTLYSQFTNWVTTSGAKLTMREKPLVSEEYRYGGCPDLLATIDGEQVLCDLKTGKSWGGAKTISQLAAYAELLKQREGVDVKRGIVLHFGADSKLKPVDVSKEQLTAGWAVFACALSLTAALRELGDAE